MSAMTQMTRETLWLCEQCEDESHAVVEKKNRAVVKVYCSKCNVSMTNLGWIESIKEDTEPTK